MAKMDTLRIPFEQMQSEFKRILLNHQFTEDGARRCARIFTDCKYPILSLL